MICEHPYATGCMHYRGPRCWFYCLLTILRNQQLRLLQQLADPEEQPYACGSSADLNVVEASTCSVSSGCNVDGHVAHSAVKQAGSFAVIPTRHKLKRVRHMPQVGGQYVPDDVELGGPWVCPTPKQYSAKNETCDPCGEGRQNPYWGESSTHRPILRRQNPYVSPVLGLCLC